MSTYETGSAVRINPDWPLRLLTKADARKHYEHYNNRFGGQPGVIVSDTYTPDDEAKPYVERLVVVQTKDGYSTLSLAGGAYKKTDMSMIPKGLQQLSQELTQQYAGHPSPTYDAKTSPYLPYETGSRQMTYDFNLDYRKGSGDGLAGIQSAFDFCDIHIDTNHINTAGSAKNPPMEDIIIETPPSNGQTANNHQPSTDKSHIRVAESLVTEESEIYKETTTFRQFLLDASRIYGMWVFAAYCHSVAEANSNVDEDELYRDIKQMLSGQSHNVDFQEQADMVSYIIHLVQDTVPVFS